MHLVPNATKIHQQTNVAEELKEAQSWKKTERRNEEGGNGSLGQSESQETAG